MNKIEEAVAPLKNDAMDSAERFAKATIAEIHKHLESCGWDLDKAAPYPNSRMDRITYKTAMRKYCLYSLVTKATKSVRSINEPHMVCKDATCEARFIKEAREIAAIQYASFVEKLVKKIGECDTATLEGNHIWGYSFLTVTKAGAVEIWKTQQITNVSVLGKYFPQWPSRKVKAKK